MTKLPPKRSRKPQERKKPSKATFDKARRKKLEGDLDKLWAQIVRKIWCEKCGWPGCQYPSSQSHHFYHKAHGLRARWNLDNGICLDFYHHIQRVHRQGDTEPIRDAIIDKIGNDRFEQLKIDVQGIWKPTIQELEVLREDFAARLSSQLDPDTYDDLDRILEEAGI